MVVGQSKGRLGIERISIESEDQVLHPWVQDLANDVDILTYNYSSQEMYQVNKYYNIKVMTIA